MGATHIICTNVKWIYKEKKITWIRLFTNLKIDFTITIMVSWSMENIPERETEAWWLLFKSQEMACWNVPRSLQYWNNLRINYIMYYGCINKWKTTIMYTQGMPMFLNNNKPQLKKVNIYRSSKVETEVGRKNSPIIIFDMSRKSIAITIFYLIKAFIQYSQTCLIRSLLCEVNVSLKATLSLHSTCRHSQQKWPYST